MGTPPWGLHPQLYRCPPNRGNIIDFLDHTLWIQPSDGARRAMWLYPRSVADFYREFLALLRALDIDVSINPLPQEVANPIRCDEDEEHAAYDAAYAACWWRILLQSERV